VAATSVIAGCGGAAQQLQDRSDLYFHAVNIAQMQTQSRREPESGAPVYTVRIAMDLPLWPWQAVLGATVRTEIPDGTVDLKVAPGTVSGGRLRLKGRGLPRADGTRGDLYAVVRIEVPAAPTPEESKAFEALRDAAHAPKDRPAGA